MSKVISAQQAVDLIKDGDTLGLTGFVSFGLAEDILSKLEETFLREGRPRNLFAFFAAGLAGDGATRGGNHLGQKGILGKVLGGNNSLCPKLSNAIESNYFPAYMAPQGVISHLMRAIAGKKPGVLTHVGLKTFCDPRVEGCCINEKAKEERDRVVELMEVNGKEYLFYPSFPIDICLIKATTADVCGNISIEHEAVRLEQFELAAATRNSGGIVIVQVERVVEYGSIDPVKVVIPEAMVDYIVVGEPENCRQHYYPEEEHYVPSWTGEIKIPLEDRKPLPLNARKICGRRGLFELKRNGFINLGIGIPITISDIANEEGLADQMILSIESGVTGGLPVGGLATGAAYNPIAVLKQPDLFDFYDGGGIDVAYLGLAEADENGNVNVSNFFGHVPGPGGFINITQNAKKVCFMGTFTAGKSEYEIKDGKLTVIKEAGGIKFKKKVGQITFSGEYSRDANQQVFFITERAVFKLTKDGMELIEIAPGIDLEKNILAYMEFKPFISKDLKEMDPRIFRDMRMGISPEALCRV